MKHQNIEYTLKFLADYLDAEFIGNPNKKINGIAPVKSAKDNQLSFINNPKYVKYLVESKAGVLLINKKHLSDSLTHCIFVDDPYFAYSKLTNLFVIGNSNQGVSDKVTIGKKATISDKKVSIFSNVFIGDNVTIEDNVVIKSNSSIGDNVTIKSGTIINPNVTVYDNVNIGANCIIHSGVVIGADGFGFAKRKDGSWSKIHQLGGVSIGNDVEVGANSTIDCGALEDTIIEDGVKLDNQIQVGHNVIIGKNTIIAGCCAIAGSSTIGANCTIGGFSAVAGHISICDNTMITGGSGVSSSITEPGIYSSGTPGVVPTPIWRKNVVRFKNLDKVCKNFKKIENRLDKITTKENNSENA